MLFRRCAFLLTACVVLASCSASGRYASQEPHVLRIADITEPSSLNPLLAHDQDTIGYDLFFVQTLVGLDAQNRLVPILAAQVPSRANGGISADGTRITYHLRRDARFADGVPVTSADVAFTYRAILDDRNNVLSQDAYRRIASLQTPDPHTVVIRLKHAWNAAVSDLFAQSDFAFGILPAHAFESTRLSNSAWEQHPFGSGPFMVSQWRRGDRAVFVPNPYFRPKPKLAKIVLQFIPDQQSAFVALQTGDVDVAPLTPQMLTQIRGARGLKVVRTLENYTEWLSIQTIRPPANEIRVRRAIAYALDMSEIGKAYEGLYPQAGSFLPPVLRLHDASIAPYAHDSRKARALLAGRPVDAVLVVESENPIWTRIATLVQQQLAQAGMRVTIKKFPTTLFNAPDGPIRNTRFTLAIDAWLGGADPEQSIVFTCSQATPEGDNISRYCDPRFEALFADQQTTRNTEQRARDFRAMQRLIRDDLPVVPLYYEIYFDGVSGRASGFARNMLRYPVAPERWDI